MSGLYGAGNPYADMPQPKIAAEETVTAVRVKKRKAEEAHNNGLPAGWKKVASKSQKGKFSYENQYTRERISWLPDRPASKKAKDLPPAPPRVKKVKPPPMAPEQKRAKDLESLLESLPKVAKMMDKDDKYGPLCKSFHKSLYSSVAFAPGTLDAIYSVLKATQAKPARVVMEQNRKYVRAVFKRVAEKTKLFGESDHYQLKSWGLRSIQHVELTFTDDSFMFNSAAKEFKDALIDLEKVNKKAIIELTGIDDDAAAPPTVDEALVRERKEVIVESMATFLSRAKLQWAMPTVKDVFRHITDRRQLFEADLQEQIDSTVDMLHKKQYKGAGRKTEDSASGMGARTIARQSKF